MYNIYVGGYTKRISNGIYHLTLENNKLSQAKLFTQINNPTYLQYDENSSILYCNSSTDDGSSIVSFNLINFSKISSSDSTNANPCYLCLDKDNKKLYSTTYSSSIFEVRNFNPSNGNIQKPTFSFKASGSSISSPRQDSSHLHMATIKDSYIYLCDLGSDNVLVLDRLSFNLIRKINLKSGCGPRHMLFINKKAFIVTELSNELIELDYDASNGNLIPLHYFSTLPNNYTGHSQASAIRTSFDNKFLYISNRGHNSICVFKLNYNSGIDRKIQTISSYGDWCRDFNITRDNKYLIVGHEKSDNISLFSIDTDGKLSLISNDTFCPESTSICIIE